MNPQAIYGAMILTAFVGFSLFVLLRWMAHEMNK
jgi:hypothetical protein